MNRNVVDMMGRGITVPDHPQRIISLVPSQTELLFDLGLSDRIVGVTKFCIHPASARTESAVIGGTKQLDVNRVLALEPDLIIGNKEENDRDTIENLALHVPVWMSDVITLDDALHMIQSIGQLVDREIPASVLSNQIQQLFDQWIAERSQSARTVLYLIWANPWMGVAGSTFIDHMIDLAGFKNALAAQTRYPVLEKEGFRRMQPDLVFMSSEPFPFKSRHVQEMVHFFPKADILPVNGELFSWYGSRLLQSPAYFRSLSGKIKFT